MQSFPLDSNTFSVLFFLNSVNFHTIFISFIGLYCSHTVNTIIRSFYILQHTHYPQYAGPGAAGQSLRGPFGDALLEFDNTIGNLLATLEKTGVINNTLVFFTSDNGLVLLCI